MSALGQTRTIRACPLHVCFTPKLGRSEVPAELSEKGQSDTEALWLVTSDPTATVFSR